MRILKYMENYNVNFVYMNVFFSQVLDKPRYMLIKLTLFFPHCNNRTSKNSISYTFHSVFKIFFNRII